MTENARNATQLSYPNIRDKLLAYLKDCSKAEHFDSTEALEFDVHFFFDDHDFADDPGSLIGDVFYNSAEVEALTVFVRELEKAIGPGREMPDVSLVDWAPVSAAAQSAYLAITK